MSCTNCDNGCVQIVSDKCVKYTGVDIPTLGISTGDSLCSVEQALADFLITALDGTGIKPTLDPAILCDMISYYLPADPSIVDIVSALIKAACDLQDQVNAVVQDIATLNAAYTLDCLPPETDAEDTHAVVQAVITKLCALDTVVADLLLALPLTYVAQADLDQLIQDYLDSLNPTGLQATKMVPWVAYEYYGPTTGFDTSGAGIEGTQWEHVYMCNGANGTPDKRGRVAVGATNTPGNGAMDAAVNPTNPLNPAYYCNPVAPNLSTKIGTNTITLAEAQIPSHTHTPNVVLANPTHTHYTVLNGIPAVGLTNLVPIKYDQSDNSQQDYTLKGVEGTANIGLTSPTSANVSVSSQSNSLTGGGLQHNNYQPAIACYYIMYIP